MQKLIRWALALGLGFGGLIGVVGVTAYQFEARQARVEIQQKTQLVLEMAMAIRGYTEQEVATAVPTGSGSAVFHAAQVPSFAAQNAIRRVTEKLPEYQYRESALNPTNIEDLATDWEANLLRQFRADATRTEISGEIGEGAGRLFYLARPITVRSAACLACHSTPEAAPRAMVAKYGADHGFGWKMGEVVGIQLVQVVTAPAEQRARASVLLSTGMAAAVFLLVAVVSAWLAARGTRLAQDVPSAAQLQALQADLARAQTRLQALLPPGPRA